MTMRFVRVRWIFALLSLLVSIWLMTAAFKINGFGALGHIIFSMTGFIMAVLLIAPETVFRMAEWISRPFAELFFPSEEYKKPPLSYQMARRYASTRRFEEAAAEYEKIIHYHPQEHDAYVELLEVAKKLKDDKLHGKCAQVIRKRFHEEVPPMPETDTGP
jgi:hypothetical protein